MKKTKLLFIHHDGIITGSIISLRNLIVKLDKDKYEFYLLLGADGPAKQLFKEIQIKIHVIKFFGLMLQPPPSVFSYDYRHNWKALISYDKNGIIKLLNEIKPDIVHLNDITVLSAGRIAHKLGFKTVWHIRCSMEGKKSYLQYLITKKIIKNNSDFIISISEDELEDFKSFRKTKVIYNSVLLEEAEDILKLGSTFREEFNIKETEIAVGMIGNLNSQKGAWNYINAISLIIKENVKINFRFFIIAPIPSINNQLNNPYETALQLLRKNGIENLVTFTNRRNDILNVMSGLDIVCACYNMHAIGRPGFEASSVRKPVIVNSGASGKSKIVIDNVTGLVIKKESPQELCNTILSLAKNEDFRARLGNAGFQHAREHFNSDKNAKLVEDIYNDLLN